MGKTPAAPAPDADRIRERRTAEGGKIRITAAHKSALMGAYYNEMESFGKLAYGQLFQREIASGEAFRWILK